MLKTRVLTALVLVPATLWAMFGLPPNAWAAVMLVVIAIAADEWARLAGLNRLWATVFAVAVVAGGCCLLLTPYTGSVVGDGPVAQWVPVVCGLATAFWFVVAPLWLRFGWRIESKLGLVLVGGLVLLATWLAVVTLQARSAKLLLAMMAVVWIADTAAYFIGRRFGRRKLAPAISPSKTWAGVYGALVAVGVYAMLLLPFAAAAGYTRPLTTVAVAIWVALAVLLAVISIVGDLFESQLKRQRGVKDSGRLLPGHGGVLDRVDALLAAMPPAALIAQYLIR